MSRRAGTQGAVESRAGGAAALEHRRNIGRVFARGNNEERAGPPVSDCLYVFLDESGNLDFSVRGTRYFVLTSVRMKRPFPVYAALDAYKYDCLEYGLTTEYFHCSSDNRHVRGRVFGIIGEYLSAIAVHTLVVNKRAAEPPLADAEELYSSMLRELLRGVLRGPSESMADEVVVIADAVPVRSRRQAIEKSVRSALTKAFPERPRFRVLHHDSRAHYGLQMADYLCWAVFRKHERGESNYFDQIRPAICSEAEFVTKAGEPRYGHFD
jgi:hypothetical protein